MPVSTHRHPGVSVVAVMAFLSALLGSSPGWGYRFYRSFDDDSRAPRSDAAKLWSEEVWGPGGTLVWHVLDGPLWQPRFPGAEELLPSVEESLETWTRVPSSDVRWRVDGILADAEVGRDGRNTVSAEETEDFGGQARAWSRRQRGDPWEWFECDVVLSTDYVERLAEGNDNRLNTLLHEFGHCLGLRQAATTPTIRWDWSWTDSSVWQRDPPMSYGRDIDSALSEDEEIGASLLRPVSRWRRTVPLMTILRDFPYVETSRFQAVALPYGSGAFSMTVLVPRDGVGVDDVVVALDSTAWGDIVAAFHGTEVELFLPRFRMEYERDLKDDLAALGIVDAFDDRKADLTRLSPVDGLWISSVLQKALVEVTEEGTEAAAVTVPTPPPPPEPPPPPPTVRADRPFLFFIRERLTGAILFVGTHAYPPDA